LAGPGRPPSRPSRRRGCGRRFAARRSRRAGHFMFTGRGGWKDDGQRNHIAPTVCTTQPGVGRGC
jgi:hypothetical protein